MPLAEEAGDAVTLNIVSPSGDRPTGEVRFGLQNESAKLHLAVLAEWERRAPGSAAAALLQLPGMSESTAAAILDWIDADGDPRPGGAEAEYYASQRLPYEPRNGVPALLEELLLVRDVSRQALFGADADSGLSADSGPCGRQRRLGGGPRGRTALGPPADGVQCGTQHDVGRQAPDQPQPPRSQSPARAADGSLGAALGRLRGRVSAIRTLRRRGGRTAGNTQPGNAGTPRSPPDAAGLTRSRGGNSLGFGAPAQVRYRVCFGFGGGGSRVAVKTG